MQQKQEQQPAPEQEPEQEQEHDPSKVAEIKIRPNDKKTLSEFLLEGGSFNIRGKGLEGSWGTILSNPMP